MPDALVWIQHPLGVTACRCPQQHHQYHADLQVEVSSQQPGGGGPQAESELRGTFGRGVDNTKGPVA
jgi:hypothetical protein